MRKKTTLWLSLLTRITGYVNKPADHLKLNAFIYSYVDVQNNILFCVVSLREKDVELGKKKRFQETIFYSPR